MKTQTKGKFPCGEMEQRALNFTQRINHRRMWQWINQTAIHYIFITFSKLYILKNVEQDLYKVAVHCKNALQHSLPMSNFMLKSPHPGKSTFAHFLEVKMDTKLNLNL